MTQEERAIRIGPRAGSALRELGRRWTVLASVSGAIYIESDARDILWITASVAALHQRVILLNDLPGTRPIAGTACSIEDGCLLLGEETLINISGARVWLPKPLGMEGPLEPGLTKRAADAFERIALQSPPRGVLARIAFLSTADRLRRFRGTLGAEVAAVAWRAVSGLRRIPTGRAVPAGLHEASGLVGLGEGLTPSGDDLLGGFLFTLRTLDLALRGLLGIEWQHVEAWLRRIERHTNKISFSILADHAHGGAAAPLTEFVHAVLEGSSQERLVDLGSRVARIGHSSGWDMLTGVHCACSAVARILNDPLDGRRVDAGLHQLTSRFQSLKEVVRVC